MEAEDFTEAAALKRALLDTTATDAVSRVMAELKVRSLAASSPIPALIVNT